MPVPFCHCWITDRTLTTLSTPLVCSEETLAVWEAWASAVLSLPAEVAEERGVDQTIANWETNAQCKSLSDNFDSLPCKRFVKSATKVGAFAESTDEQYMLQKLGASRRQMYVTHLDFVRT